jgi:hypothetical protein
MEITAQLDPKYTEKIALIQRQTQQDLSEIVGRAITSGKLANDLYYRR